MYNDTHVCPLDIYAHVCACVSKVVFTSHTAFSIWSFSKKEKEEFKIEIETYLAVCIIHFKIGGVLLLKYDQKVAYDKEMFLQRNEIELHVS